MIDRTSEPARHDPAGPAAVVALVVGFLALTLGPVLGGIDHFPEKSIDMDRNHVPVVRTFAAEWPSPDLVEYDSATTPGMHLLMAAVVRFVGDSETMLQVLSVSFGLLLVLVACRFSSRVVPLAVAVACTLPLALSPYTIGNSIWVMTDNLSLALVAVTMGIAIFRRPTIASSAVSGVALVAAVLVRQINVWPSAMALVAAAFGLEAVRRRVPFRDRLDDRVTAGPLVVLGCFVLLAFATLAAFVSAWGGLVPPPFQPGGEGAATHSGGLNPAVTPYVLALVGVYAAPALLVLFPCWREDPAIRRWAVSGGLAGLVAALVLPSAPGLDLGRVGGWLWTLAAAGPVVLDRSLVIVVGASFGGLALGGLLGLGARAGRLRAGWLLVGFGASFLAAYTANAQAFQRYFDPPVLLVLGWLLATCHGARTSGGLVSGARISAAGIACGAMQLALAVLTIYLRIGRPPLEG